MEATARKRKLVSHLSDYLVEFVHADETNSQPTNKKPKINKSAPKPNNNTPKSTNTVVSNQQSKSHL